MEGIALKMTREEYYRTACWGLLIIYGSETAEADLRALDKNYERLNNLSDQELAKRCAAWGREAFISAGNKKI